ncbi:MAG TPA: alpha/beta hydrolase [Ktedonobacterales bacterium]|nr:alpha/beta hydrolase [Ktedonobacterales bacterium]
MNYIEMDGMRIAYERQGSGPPLVLLHGAFGFDSQSWRRQIDALSDEFTVVAWDMPGCGQSSDPPENFLATDYANCLAACIDTLELTQPHVLGLSFGSVLALELYRRFPKVPRSLVLASAYAGWVSSLSPEAVEQRRRLIFSSLDLPPEQWARQWSPSMLSDKAPPALFEEVEASLSRFHQEGQRRLIEAFAQQDLRDVLPHISVPTLLVYGEKDSRSPLNVAHDMHASIPNSRLVVIPDVGHMCNIEAPERFNAEVRQFLHSVPK